MNHCHLEMRLHRCMNRENGCSLEPCSSLWHDVSMAWIWVSCSCSDILLGWIVMKEGNRPVLHRDAYCYWVSVSDRYWSKMCSRYWWLESMQSFDTHHFFFSSNFSYTVETAYSDHGYSDQPLIWIKRLGTESFLYKCCLNNLFIVIKKSAYSVHFWAFYEWKHVQKLF